jgi:hypothetical protein
MDSARIIYELCTVKYRIPKKQRIEYYLIPHKTCSRMAIQQLCDAIEAYTNDLMFDEISYNIDACQVDAKFLLEILRTKSINAKIIFLQ